jgi:uncharacterized SAM-binding protein YcdF (DUF218 family)
VSGALAAATEVIVVLGSTSSAVQRAEAAAALARQRPGAVIIASGRSTFGREPERSEAQVIADVLRSAGIAEERILLEDGSRDTIGNAVLTATRYLSDVTARPLTVVTSPFHLERALFIFRQVLGPAWPITGHASAALPGDDERARDEARYLDETRRMFSGTAPGDVRRAASLLRERWPGSYGGLARLRSDE